MDRTFLTMSTYQIDSQALLVQWFPTGFASDFPGHNSTVQYSLFIYFSLRNNIFRDFLFKIVKKWAPPSLGVMSAHKRSEKMMAHSARWNLYTVPKIDSIYTIVYIQMHSKNQ